MASTEAALTFHRLLPETQAAQDAYLDFLRIKDPRSAADEADARYLAERLSALKAIDPGALLNEAEELERAAASPEFANLLAPAAELRAKAAALSMKAAA